MSTVTRKKKQSAQDAAISEPVIIEPTLSHQRPINFRFECPHCKELILLHAHAGIGLYDVVPAPGFNPDVTRDKRFKPEQLLVLDRAEKTGTMAAFKEMLPFRKGSRPPNLQQFFLLVLRNMRHRIVHADVLELFREVIPQAYVGIHCAEGVACITAGDNLRFFMPQSLLIGTPLVHVGQTNRGAHQQLRHDIPYDGIREWLQVGRAAIRESPEASLDTLQKPLLTIPVEEDQYQESV